MTKQDPRFAIKITNERARQLYAETVETLYEYTTKIAPPGSDERPRYSIDVLELGQILNEFISARTALALDDIVPIAVDPSIVRAICECDARSDRCGEELIDQIMARLGDDEYIAKWMTEHVHAAHLFQAMPHRMRERVVRQVLDQIDQAALAEWRARTKGKQL